MNVHRLSQQSDNWPMTASSDETIVGDESEDFSSVGMSEMDTILDEEEEEEQDMEKLLRKAEEILTKQEEERSKGDNPTVSKVTLPKLQPGIDITSHLYISTTTPIARLNPSTTLVADPNSTPSTSLESLKLSAHSYAPFPSRAEARAQRESTAGKAWFDMPKPELTPELRRDLQVLRMRSVLDPKRFYKKDEFSNKKNKDGPKYFQVGTVIEGPSEFYSSRLSRKERKRTIVEELLADSDAREYQKNKYREIQERGMEGGKKFYKNIKAMRKVGWEK